MMNHTNQSQGADTTIEAIHKTRERMADACKGDIHAISAAARKRQQESGRASVSYAKDASKTPIVAR